jgi:hypothetical protein
MEYTTAGDDEAAPAVSNEIVMPSGGQFYPASRYAAAIDDESKLRALDRPLGTCEGNQWEPTLGSDMYDARKLVPTRGVPSDPSRIQEVAFPKALLRTGPYDCRAENDAYAIQTTSDYMFNNATKQDRYKAMKKPTKPGPPEGALKAAPETLRPDLLLNAGPPRPMNQPASVAVVSGSARAQAPVYVSGSDGGYYYNPSDLTSAMEKNQRARAGSNGLAWIGDSQQQQKTNPDPNLSYQYMAANQRDNLQANAVAPKKPMITSPYSENSPFAAF